MSNLLRHRHPELKRPLVVLLACGVLVGASPASAIAGGGKPKKNDTQQSFGGDGRRN